MTISLTQNLTIARLLKYCLLICVLSAPKSFATIVQVQTNLGAFEINLFDKITPITVANFLTYVESEAYNNSIIHRLEPGFVIQGGGYKIDETLPLETIPNLAPIVNEPVLSNVRGTISMAKLGGNPNSATSEWFINIGNNQANLDAQNQGFTVFGTVTGNGMQIVDAIAALPRFDLTQGLSTTPLIDYSLDDAQNSVEVEIDNFVTIESITILDASVDSADSLSPTLNTSDSRPSSPGGSGGGGGSANLLSLLLFAALGAFGVNIVRGRRQF